MSQVHIEKSDDDHSELSINVKRAPDNNINSFEQLSVDGKIEIIDRIGIKNLISFSKTNKENNSLVKRRIQLIRHDLASNGLTQQEMK